MLNKTIIASAISSHFAHICKSNYLPMEDAGYFFIIDGKKYLTAASSYIYYLNGFVENLFNYESLHELGFDQPTQYHDDDDLKPFYQKLNT